MGRFAVGIFISLLKLSDFVKIDSRLIIHVTLVTFVGKKEPLMHSIRRERNSTQLVMSSDSDDF